MPEVVLRRQTGARRVVEAPDPLPGTLTIDGVCYVYAPLAEAGDSRPWYVEAPPAPPSSDSACTGAQGVAR